MQLNVNIAVEFCVFFCRIVEKHVSMNSPMFLFLKDSEIGLGSDK